MKRADGVAEKAMLSAYIFRLKILIARFFNTRDIGSLSNHDQKIVRA